jgi:hypothetical protein
VSCSFLDGWIEKALNGLLFQGTLWRINQKE